MANSPQTPRRAESVPVVLAALSGGLIGWGVSGLLFIVAWAIFVFAPGVEGHGPAYVFLGGLYVFGGPLTLVSGFLAGIAAAEGAKRRSCWAGGLHGTYVGLGFTGAFIGLLLIVAVPRAGIGAVLEQAGAFLVISCYFAVGAVGVAVGGFVGAWIGTSAP